VFQRSYGEGSFEFEQDEEMSFASEMFDLRRILTLSEGEKITNDFVSLLILI